MLVPAAHTVSSFNPASSASRREPPSAPQEDKRGKEKDIKDPQSQSPQPQPQPQPPPLQLITSTQNKTVRY